MNLREIANRVARAEIMGAAKAGQPKVDSAGPGSKFKYKVTHPSGKVEYTNTAPGTTKSKGDKPVKGKPKGDSKEKTVKKVVEKGDGKGDLGTKKVVDKVLEKVKEKGDGGVRGKGKKVVETGKKVVETGKGIAKGLSEIGKKIGEEIKNAPANLKEFVKNPKARKKAIDKTVKAVKKAPKKIAKALYHSAKKELKSIKQAGKAVGKLATGKKLTKGDKHAMYATGVYVVGTILGGVAGGMIGGSLALGHSFKLHVAIKAVAEIADEGFLGFEALESGHHVIEALSHLSHVASDGTAQDGEPSQDKLEEMAINLIFGHVMKILEEGISEEDMQSIMKGTEVPA